MSEKAVNYTPEMTAKAIELYEGGVAIDDIAEAIGKTVRSVRSKLVREGVYVAQPKATARKSDEPTKKELLRDLEEALPSDFPIAGMMGATKEAIVALMGVVKN
tara:strand:+ start:3891 stop:4202 length:312 start_codon:yes stop_codon:yes gene_type:complete